MPTLIPAREAIREHIHFQPHWLSGAMPLEHRLTGVQGFSKELLANYGVKFNRDESYGIVAYNHIIYTFQKNLEGKYNLCSAVDSTKLSKED